MSMAKIEKFPNKKKQKMLGIIKGILIVAAIFIIPLGISEATTQMELHKRDAIIECMEEGYRFVVDGVDFDYETIYDLDDFMENYYKVSQDDTNKVIVFQHITRRE